jgi:hypothetical protein
MNRLKNTANGGFDLKSDDLRWMQDATLQAFKGIVSPFLSSTNEVVILSGCDFISSGAPDFDTNISEGFVIYNGEVYYHPQINAIGIPSPQFYYWSFETLYDPAGLKTFKDPNILGTNDTYEIRIAKLILSIAPLQGHQSYISTKTIHEKIRGSISNIKIPWINLPTQYPGTSDENKTKYMKDIDGFVHLKGFYQIDLWFSSIALDTLPVGYRPIDVIEFPYLMYTASGVQKKTSIYINPNGLIVYEGDNPYESLQIQEGFSINFGLIPPFRTV